MRYLAGFAALCAAVAGIDFLVHGERHAGFLRGLAFASVAGFLASIVAMVLLSLLAHRGRS